MAGITGFGGREVALSVVLAASGCLLLYSIRGTDYSIRESRLPNG